MNTKTLPKPTELETRVLRQISHILPTEEPPLPKKYIPVCEPSITTKEASYVKQALLSGWISSGGTFVEQFERAFAKKVANTRYAVAVNSGTSAIHLALSALGIGPSDEVIIPTFTMIATANAVRYTGATPILVDADPETWNIDVKQIESKITKQTKAIIPVHIYGSAADMNPILKIAKKYNLWVIEDAAEAQGAEYQGKRVGGIGDLGAFSLYANKIATTGEGGMITTNEKKLAERLKLLRDHAFSTKRHFWHNFLGYGYRITNLQAALGLAQTERFTALLQARIRNAKLYIKHLRGTPGLSFPVIKPEVRHVYWMFSLLVDKKKFGVSKNQLRRFLAKAGIETRSFFIPMHLQPIYYKSYKRQHFPVAEHLCQMGFYLPSASTLTQKQIAYIARVIKEAHRKGTKS